MKELNEKELKRLLEEQLAQDGKERSPENDDDADIYRLLFTALADEPNTPLNIDLAESVVKQIKINELKKESIRYNMLIVFVVIAGLLSAYFAISYINPAALNSALNFIETYRWIVVFIILCFGIIQVADKNLVKKNLSST
jgi:hypothetical protein